MGKSSGLVVAADLNVKCQTSHVECQMYLTKRPTDPSHWVIWSSGQVSLPFDIGRLTFDIQIGRRGSPDRAFDHEQQQRRGKAQGCVVLPVGQIL